MVGDHTAAGSHHARLGADAPAGTDLRCSLEEREGRRFRCDARHAHGGASSSPVSGVARREKHGVGIPFLAVSCSPGTQTNERKRDS